VAECLLSKCKALSSNSNTVKKKEQKGGRDTHHLSWDPKTGRQKQNEVPHSPTPSGWKDERSSIRDVEDMRSGHFRGSWG
jgi:hypothetical protein